MTFQGTPSQQWWEVMERRRKAHLERELITEQDGRTRYQPPVQTVSEQEKFEDPEAFCRYCGEDTALCMCDLTGSAGYSDDALGWGQ